MLYWVIWLEALDVKDPYGCVIGRTIPTRRWYEWRPEMDLALGW